MKKNLLKKLVPFIGVLALGVSVIACGAGDNKEASSDNKIIRVGTSAGPYSELFLEGIAPILEKQGYTIEDTSFSDLLQVNIALTEGSIDLNVDQHTAYAENFNVEKGATLTPIVHVPTVPAGILSEKHKSLDDVKDGSIVAIPKDPSNAARAYNLLDKAGWIKLKEGIEPMKASSNDILENLHNLEIQEIESSQIPRALEDVDFGVIPGSVVYSAGLSADSVLLLEDVLDKLELVAVVTGKNKEMQWAKDVVIAYKSDDFKKFLVEENKEEYWHIPKELK